MCIYNFYSIVHINVSVDGIDSIYYHIYSNAKLGCFFPSPIGMGGEKKPLML